MSNSTSPRDELQSPREAVGSPKRFWTSVSSSTEIRKSPSEKVCMERKVKQQKTHSKVKEKKRKGAKKLGRRRRKQ